MGMSSSDDDRKILAEHAVMEKIKKLHPTYELDVEGMTEDQKIIYEDGLLKRYRKLWNG